jgi:hypothetical protein
MRKEIVMKRLKRLSVLLVSLVVCAGLAVAQGFEVVPDPSAPERPAGTETFISMEGRFSISLPKQVSGFSPSSGGNTSGVSFTWKLKEGTFIVQYLTMPQPMENRSKQFFDLFRQQVSSSTKLKIQVVSERDLSLDGHPGYELRTESDKVFSITRAYLVGNRGYQVLMILPFTKKDEEQAAIKILDSFKLLSEEDVAAELKRKVAEATPSPLPQEPVAKKAKSDAQDEGLKGKVKTVFTESEDLSGAGSVSGRKPTSMDYYNERGNLTKQELYDYRGNPYDIIVYGYLDGDRVALFKTIQYEYNPPPMMMPTVPGQPPPKSDPRYSRKQKYKYDNKGRLIEKALSGNDDRLWLRYVFKYQDNTREEAVYDEKGVLNQKYLVTYDDKGNEQEKTIFDGKDNAVIEKFSYVYEFDDKGNWIKRTTSRWTTKDGKSAFTPYSIDYRTITYY